MDAKATATVARELAEAKRGFEQWRRSRKRERRIPERLWRMAAQAAAVHGVSRTARWLGLNPARLKQWMETPAQDEVSQEEPRFVEWPWPVAAATAECLLEAEDQLGNKLRIHLKGEATAQAVALGRALWKE